MTKILLVEDDESLREIYGTRLIAEGYDVVTAGDGEIALAVAIKDRPDLILSDVMMPKVSGFEMIDILKSTTETKDIKVVVMTALSNDSQRQRGEALGVDRYLVKSQVGIEDVVATIHELLGDKEGAKGPVTPAPTAAPEPTPASPNSAPLNAPQPIRPPIVAAQPALNEQGMVTNDVAAYGDNQKKIIAPLDPNLTLHSEPTSPLVPTDIAAPESEPTAEPMPPAEPLAPEAPAAAGPAAPPPPDAPTAPPAP
ncbi:MAG: response regulator [Candidatus Nomurabacteria bacterium]|jgi:DNA-binding response OmpR family regulator|nr:response regulator [Candidatus Nomurabacteria bacterium]